MSQLRERVERAEDALGMALPASTPLDGLEVALADQAARPHTDLADLVFDAAVDRAIMNALTTESLAASAASPDVSRRAVAIVGLPRTGSTLLHNVLALAEGATTVSHLNAVNATWRTGAVTRDEALADVTARLDLMDALSPGIRDRHPVQPLWPDECTLLLANTGGSYQWPIMFDLPGHLSWLAGADLGPHYEAYGRALSVLTDPKAEILVTKSPFHILQLEQLRRTIPGVRIVATVRSSADVVPSWFGLLEAIQAPLYGASGLPQPLVSRWTAALESMAVHLVDAVEGGLVDVVVQFDDLLTDPVAVARQIVGDDLAAGLDARVGLWSGHPEAQRRGAPASWISAGASAALRRHDEYFCLTEGDRP
jgi:hypothetical protein